MEFDQNEDIRNAGENIPASAKPQTNHGSQTVPPALQNQSAQAAAVSPILNSPIQTDPMEVHHSHHPSHKKKWKEYLFEFFMLFLAVFLGFVAENTREGVVEGHREKEFVRLFTEDLENDTSIIKAAVPKMRQTIKGIDTLIAQTYLLLEGKADTRLLYYAYHHCCRLAFDIKLSERTINQLKSSGSLRLIRNKEAAEIISSVELGLEYMQQKIRFVQGRQEDPANFGLKIFDFKEYQRANTMADGVINTDDKGFLQLAYQPDVNTKDSIYLKEFAARAGYYRNALYDLSVTLEKAVPLIIDYSNTLKKNYHL